MSQRDKPPAPPRTRLVAHSWPIPQGDVMRELLVLEHGTIQQIIEPPVDPRESSDLEEEDISDADDDTKEDEPHTSFKGSSTSYQVPDC